MPVPSLLLRGDRTPIKRMVAAGGPSACLEAFSFSTPQASSHVENTLGLASEIALEPVEIDPGR